MSDGPKKRRQELRQKRLHEFLNNLESQGITQRDVALKAKVNPQFLNDVKQGRRPVGELLARRLHEEFGVDYLWLLAKQGSMDQPPVGSDVTAAQRALLPVFSDPVEGNPRLHRKWDGAVVELAGSAAAQVLLAHQPYVLRFGAEDRCRRLRKRDLLLISQQVNPDAEIHVIKVASNMYLARKISGRWERVAPGSDISREPTVVGHAVVIIWGSLDPPPVNRDEGRAALLESGA